MDPRLEELLQREIDGATSAEESAELHRRLMEEPAARELHDRLQRLAEDLRRVGQEEVPAGLRQEILAAVERSERARSGAVATHRRTPGVRRRDLLPFAAGLAAGLALFALLSGGGGPDPAVDPDALTGTMRPGARSAEELSADAQRIEGPGVVATALLRVHRDEAVVDLHLRSDRPLETTLESVGGLTPLFGERRGPEAGEIRLTEGACRVVQEGEGRYRFVLRGEGEAATASLRLRLRSGDWSQQISLVPGGKGDS